MNKSEMSFATALINKVITTEISETFYGYQKVNFKFTNNNLKGLYNLATSKMPEVWQHVTANSRGKLMLYRSNGFSVEFAVYNPDNLEGATDLGTVKFADGTTAELTHCWSSNTTSFYEATGKSLVPIWCEGKEVFIRLGYATALASMLGLQIVEKEDAIYKGEGMSWHFAKRTR